MKKAKTSGRRRVAGLATAAAAALGGLLVAPTPAHAAWGTTYTFSIQDTYQYPTGTTVQLGHVDGWVQFDDGGNSFRYSLTACQQSSYTPPKIQVAVNAGYVGSTWQETDLEYLSLPSGCNTVTGQDTYADYWNVAFTLYGDTFTPAHTTVSKRWVASNPY
ncbi:hypothetical protein OG900_08275 [Streptomyces sp. NBC_00433]